MIESTDILKSTLKIMGDGQSKFNFVDFEFPRKSSKDNVRKSVYLKQSIQNNRK